MRATLLDTGFMVKVILVLRIQGCFLWNRYFIICYGNRYGNRPTESIKSHAFLVSGV